MEEPRFFLGADLGQVSDYTAFAVVEKLKAEAGEDGTPAGLPERGARYPGQPGALLHVRYLARVRERPYTEIAARIRELCSAPQLTTFHPRNMLVDGEVLVRDELAVPPALAVDATGVGRPVVDLLRSHGLRFSAVTITGGEAAGYSNGYHRLPKRDLVSALQVSLQNGWLKIAQDLELAETLKRELLNFKMTINLSTGHDSYAAWR